MSQPLTAKQIRDIIAASASASLAQVEHLLVGAGIDVATLARAIGGNAAQILIVEMDAE